MDPSERLRLVIVDDNAGTRVLLRALAERDERFVVVGEAADGLEAVAVTRTEQPDAILLDIMMPVVSGLEAIPDILSVSPRTRIVGYSAYEGYREEALELGAHGWCTKGLPWADVAETIVGLTTERDEAASTSENHRS